MVSVRRGESYPTGYTRLELHGQFDRTIEEIDPHWFWLLGQENDALCASLGSLNKETRRAILTCDAQEAPNVGSPTLFYLSPYWQAYHVWMVLDPNWGWARTRFDGKDAVAEDYEASSISIVDGREVKVWTKLEPLDGSGVMSRHYPSGDQTPVGSPKARIIPGGWDHEHCSLCKEHIDAGQLGYCDPDKRWICEKCYERYVVPRDLSFVDEL